MYCIKAEIPQNICDIDDELKVNYHGKDTVRIWVFQSGDDRNKFMYNTERMLKAERESHYKQHFS